MIERIINSIIRAIDALYPDIPILDNTIEQDILRPGFYIRCYHSFLNERIKPAGFFKTYCFEITYEPGEIDSDIKCREVEDTLTVPLRRIEDSESDFAFRPVNIEFKQIDDYLQILFDIVVNLKVEGEPYPTIDNYSINTGVYK